MLLNIIYTLLIPTTILINDICITSLNDSISEKVLEMNCNNFKENFKKISSLKNTYDTFDQYKLDLFHIESTAIDFLKDFNLIPDATSNIFTNTEINAFTTIYLTAVFRLVSGVYSDYYILPVSSIPQGLIHELLLINSKFVNECYDISRNPLPKNLINEFSLLRDNLILKGGIQNCNRGEADYLSGLQNYIEVIRYNSINKLHSTEFIHPNQITNKLNGFNFLNPKFCLKDLSLNIFENKILTSRFQTGHLNFNKSVDISILEKQTLLETTKYSYFNPILVFSLCGVGVLLYRNICY